MPSQLEGRFRCLHLLHYSFVPNERRPSEAHLACIYLGSYNLRQVICVPSATELAFVENFDCVFIFAQVWERETLAFCMKPSVAMSSRWFALSGRLALKGCLGSHCVSQLIRGEGRDGLAPHTERQTQSKQWEGPGKTRPASDKAQQIRADHNKAKRSSQSSAARRQRLCL